jgi:sulfur-oxidizing protein SoxY
MSAQSQPSPPNPERRQALRQTAALLLAVTVTPVFGQKASTEITTAPKATRDAIGRFTQDKPIEIGRVKLDVSELVENGHAVPVTIRVDAKVGEVGAIALFTEENPQPDVAVFNVKHAAKTQVATRMRIAKSQRVWAMARMTDGRCFAQPVQVIVTLAACVEGA